MCGLTACLGADREHPADGAWVASATAALGHRGPDDSGFHAGAGVALGFRRLAVMDPSPRGHQPMCSADGRYWLVFNGEVYNFRELGATLEAQGVVLRTTCDTEVVLELLARRGVDALDDLRGMYALVLYDSLEGELLAARDPFGIKPLYYSWQDGVLRLASEKKALAPAVAGDPVDPDAVRLLLSFGFVPPPQTMSADIRSVPPGHTLRARHGEPPRLSRSCATAFRPARPGRATRPSTAEPILDALRESVSLHLRSDVPVGALLSGGVDSAAICALAAEQRPGLDVFTVGFDREGYSEVALAQDTAAALGLSHHGLHVDLDEFVECLPRIVWHLDDPLGDASAVPLWFVAREARRHVGVVLSGEGADELFGGYHNYRAAVMSQARRVPADYIGGEHVFVRGEIDGMALAGSASVDDVVGPVKDKARAAGVDVVTGMQLVDLRAWLPGDILTKADRLTMAHGLELRVPFLDRGVTEVAAALSLADKIAGHTTKYALRRAVAGLVPPAVAERPKLGFPVPMGHWLRGELFGFADNLFREAEVDRYIRRDAALDLLRRYRAGEDFDWRKLWVLVSFCLWHQVHVERRYDPVALGWQAELPVARLGRDG
ncbi:asparagine synthase (glutamine-hydrolyzing) [Knoellia locipacati]|uniref:asparagine synthase (glutamine-hydrolyzing) n=1 Tax=Knoellia locipacati TaxID=882824 RepID=UPI00384DD245